MEQAFQVEVGTCADQLDIDAVGLVEAFAALETEYVQVVLARIEGQFEALLIRRAEHPLFLLPKGGG